MRADFCVPVRYFRLSGLSEKWKPGRNPTLFAHPGILAHPAGIHRHQFHPLDRSVLPDAGDPGDFCDWYRFYPVVFAVKSAGPGDSHPGLGHHFWA